MYIFFYIVSFNYWNYFPFFVFVFVKPLLYGHLMWGKCCLIWTEWQYKPLWHPSEVDKNKVRCVRERKANCRGLRAPTEDNKITVDPLASSSWFLISREACKFYLMPLDAGYDQHDKVWPRADWYNYFFVRILADGWGGNDASRVLRSLGGWLDSFCIKEGAFA